MAKKLNSFPCPKCGQPTEVINSRGIGKVDGETTIKRRRRCLSCGSHIATFESAVGSQVMQRNVERARTRLKAVAATINKLLVGV